MREGSRKIERTADRLTGKRHLFVFSPSRDDRSYQMQMDALSEKRCALNENGIELEAIFESDSDFSLRNELGVTPGQFKIVLLGKDASIQMSAESCISCEEVIMRVQSEPELVEANA